MVRRPRHLTGPWYRTLLLILGSLIFGAFLVVQDEILTEAMWCGRTCQYPYPLLGPFSLYDAESIASGMMILGLFLVVYASREPKGLSSTVTSKEVTMSGVGILKLSRKAHIALQALTTVTASYLSALVAIYTPAMVAVPTIAFIAGVGSLTVTALSTNG